MLPRSKKPISHPLIWKRLPFLGLVSIHEPQIRNYVFHGSSWTAYYKFSIAGRHLTHQHNWQLETSMDRHNFIYNKKRFWAAGNFLCVGLVTNFPFVTYVGFYYSLFLVNDSLYITTNLQFITLAPPGYFFVNSIYSLFWNGCLSNH